MECFESWARVATFEGRIVRERVYFYQDTNIVTYYIFESEIHEWLFFRKAGTSSKQFSLLTILSTRGDK